MRLLITGGAGFIGSALVKKTVADKHYVVTVDKLTYAGRREALEDTLSAPNHQFIEADIVDRRKIDSVLDEHQPDAILHLAAESHVDRSIDGPAVFVQTNVVGTCVLLEAALAYWGAGRDPGFRFIHVSTDEVFGSLGDSGTFTADSRYRPTSPYAASKAAADHLARAWHATYGLPVIITNCSNNYGPRQHAEKFIPTVIRHALAGMPVPIYGTGKNRRDWLFVGDHVEGLMRALTVGVAGATYLFGSEGKSISNLTLAQAICARLDVQQPRHDGKSYIEQIEFVADRPGHDFRYAVDAAASRIQLGWIPRVSLEDGLERTIDWYIENPTWLVPAGALGRLGLGISSRVDGSP